MPASRAPEKVIARLELVPDARQRLSRLFRQALTGTFDSRIYLALAAAEKVPTVAASLRRVDFLAQSSEELGYSLGLR